MAKNSIKSILSPTRILTLDRIAFLILGLVLFTANSMADVVERSNPNNTYTASGSDVATVQTTANAAEGDVLTISGTATHNSNVEPFNSFTVQSANSSIQTINAGTAGFYTLGDSGDYIISLSNLFYQGNSSAVSDVTGLFLHSTSDSTFNINTDNVTFNGFKNASQDGGAFAIDSSGKLNITATNGLVFDSNRVTASGKNGGAIRMATSAGALTINADTLTFKDNYAQKHGGAIYARSLSITGNTLLFSGNTAKDNDGGAINASPVTISGIDEDSTITFKNNSAHGIGGAITTGVLTLSTGSFYFDNNVLTTALKDGRAGAVNGSTITISNVQTLSFTNNTSASKAGALYATGDISISAQNVTFEKNKTTAGTLSNVECGKGGGIFADGGNVTINANTILFKGNSAKQYGGAIRIENSNKNLSLTGTTITFENNSVSDNRGGAISSTGGATINANTILFKGNSAKTYGGAIRIENSNKNLSLTGKTITFENNSVSGNDGGAISGSNLTITGKDSASVTTFKNNSCKYIGGAIGNSSATFSTGSFYFDNNKATTYHTNARGGAIHSGSVKFLNAENISFTNNVGTYLGGAISATSVEISAKNITFTGNKAYVSGQTNGQGGAIYCTGAVTFSGEDATAVFSNNTATNAGNDLYLSGTGGLTFKDNGTYSFDGGIYINTTNHPDTVINEAQVTIAGRANDSTNNYQFYNVNISNGGKLTINWDNINSLTGTFNTGTADSAGTLEFNVGEGVVKKIKADVIKIVRTDMGEVIKTGDGTLQLYSEAQGSIDINGLVVSSGRVDLLGYMNGLIEVDDGAEFSPGNSVGDATFGGGFILNENGKLLIEQDATGIDTLTASSFEIDSNSIIELSADSLQPGAEYPIIINSSGNFGGDQASDEFWNGLLTPGSDYYWNLIVRGNTVYASVDANAVPEPSTWALLALGVIVLFLRKRVRS